MLGHVHLVVGCRVEHHVGIGAGQGMFHRDGVSDIHLAPSETRDRKTPALEFPG